MGPVADSSLLRGTQHFNPSEPMIASLDDCPPGFVAVLENCRIGDWELTGMVFEWWGRRGIQWFQPLREGDGRSDPFNEADFDMSRPVWRFERCPHPDRMSSQLGKPLSVWKRIS